MTRDAPTLASAAHEVFTTLRRTGHRACVIGGLAVLRWGEPRTTMDVDISVLTGYGNEDRTIDTLVREFRPRLPNLREFAMRTRVVLIESSSGVSIDVALAALPFEQEAIELAQPWEAAPGLLLTVCPPEHLIVYKLVAGRPQDLVDVTGIVLRQGGRLDVECVRRWGREFAELKEDPDLLRPFEDAVRRARA